MRLVIVFVAMLVIGAGSARADDTPSAAPPMSGWFENLVGRFESEAAHDVSMAPVVSSALSREWRSFDRDGFALAVFVDIGWVAAAAVAALLAERAVAGLVSRRVRRRMRARDGGPQLVDLTGLLFADLIGLAVFFTVFTAARRHFFPLVGTTELLSAYAANTLIRWRIAAVVLGAVLRPHEPVGRLIEISDREAHRLGRFVSAAILMIILLVGFGRVALMDEDSGAAHVIGLVNAVLVCGLYVAIMLRARGATEALIRGRRRSGVVAAIRAGLASAWLSIAFALIAGLLVFFVAGLSLGLLSYYHAVTTTLGIGFVVLVLDRLTERVWHDETDSGAAIPNGVGELQARAAHHIVRAVGGVVAAMTLAWIWIGATGHVDPGASPALRSTAAALGTLFIAFVAWELVRLAIDRHLLDVGTGPSLPGAGDNDVEASPASRLQTILPMVRAAFAVVIGVLAALIVLSRLGVDTAPLIAGAGVFGLAVSFGSQSLVRDIISGLFYMWDDAFRVGEYIDTGRLKGTVEVLGIRSVKLRHQNGPLHTIPYGQLGAVTNLSRDYATIKFNLRLETGTDIELVRKTAKQLGLAMQEDPEMAAEIILPLKLQGVAEVADNALVLRFKFTARPVKPSWVQREYLKRMVQAFAEKGIKFATGAMLLHTAPPEAHAEATPEAPPPTRRTPRARRTKAAPVADPAAVAEAAK
ncbi:MAG TPA: mechanosensitive ion channel domain-containing protein [Stellaceae bacterium]|nr:mechanosensitive ion channel domain-containing protein [Stellaceae bacterium]